MPTFGTWLADLASRCNALTNLGAAAGGVPSGTQPLGVE